MNLDHRANKNIVGLFVGQCGVQIGNLFWQQMAAEHHINNHEGKDPYAASAMFTETFSGTFKARALFIDNDELTLQTLANSSLKDLFSNNAMIQGTGETGGLYCHARYGQDKEFIDNIHDEYRRLLENCDICCEVFHVCGANGGTGSGLVPEIILSTGLDSKITQVGVKIYPSPNVSGTTVDYYNTLLHFNATHDLTDINICMDNEALFAQVTEYTLNPHVSFVDINHMVSMIISQFTQGERYGTSMSANDFQTNMVPFPGLNYLIPSNGLPDSHYPSGNAVTVYNDLAYLLNDDSPCLTADLQDGKFVASTICCRGELYFTGELNRSVGRYRRDHPYKYIDWMPHSIQIDICQTPLPAIKTTKLDYSGRAMTILSCHTAYADVLKNYLLSTQQMYKHHAYLHWYQTYIEMKTELPVAIQTVSLLHKVYSSISPVNVETSESID